MRRFVYALAVVAMAAAPLPAVAQHPTTHAHAASPQAAADALLAADRTFATASANSEGLAAFGRMFDDDVVMFAVPVPGFAHGRADGVAALARALGGETGRTEWTPIRVGISADGQHGFTFGYTVTRRDGEPPRHGKYLSYWEKGPQGWRVSVYKRAPRPDGDISMDLSPASLPAALVPVSADAAAIEAARASLDSRERAFSAEAQRVGLGPAFAEFGSADAVNLGGGPEFIVGAQAIGDSQGSGPSPITWAPDGGVIVASSGDMGLTWGFLRRTGPVPEGRLAEIPYFTIWRRASPDAPWLYVAE